MSPRRLELKEGGPAVDWSDLSDDEAFALDASGLVTVSRPPGHRAWRVAPTRKVGSARVGPDLQVSVMPKVDIARLLFMMGFARRPDLWRDELVELDEHEDLMGALADAFCRMAANATARGLFQGYRTVDDSLQVMRGRLRVAEQIRAHQGVALPLEVTYDEFTVDVPENQILLAATVRLLRTPNVSVDARSALQRLRVALADVSLVDHAPRWQLNRLNRHYEAALQLAELILALDSVDLTPGSSRVRVTGFVLDVWRVFEDFVCSALGRSLERFGGTATHGFSYYLDTRTAINLKPDLVWRRGGMVQVVVDAKYKETRFDSFPNADIYQVLAYCTALRRRHGHLVYAKGEGPSRSYVVRESGITIHCHTLDLAASPSDLLSQVDILGDRLARRHLTSP